MILQDVFLPTPLPLSYVGPYLQADGKPCVIYLALSAKESLLTDPYNQAVKVLFENEFRVFSLDLPFHGETMASADAIKRWAEAGEKGDLILDKFLDQLEESLILLLTFLKPVDVAIMGLSRGGLLSAHIASRIQSISKILCFAPLTHLDQCQEFKEYGLKTPSLSLLPLNPSLCSKTIKVFIGNRDLRVQTDLCYAWIRELVEEAFSKQIRSPQIELYLKPSIGYLGHGTSKETFEEGALWLSHKLKKN